VADLFSTPPVGRHGNYYLRGMAPFLKFLNFTFEGAGNKLQKIEALLVQKSPTSTAGRVSILA